MRPLMAQLLAQALTNLRTGSGWIRSAEDWVEPFPEALRRFLGVDPETPPERQRAALELRINSGLHLLSDEDEKFLDWAWNRNGSSTEIWTRRRDAHKSIRNYKAVERRFYSTVRKLVAAMLPADEPPLAVPSSKEAQAREELLRVLAYRRDWYRKRLDVSIYVAADAVTVRETWDVTARRDGVQRFAIRRHFYWAGTKVQTELTEGAELEDTIWPNNQTQVLLVRFPRPPRHDESRRFVITYRTEGMAPVYSSGWMEFDHFTARLQFSGVRPMTVWLIEHFPPGLFTTENIRPVLKTYAARVTDQVDGAGYFTYEFEPSDFTDEGIAWELPDTPWRDG